MAGEPTFVPGVNPTFDIEDNRTPRILMAEFGDGYAQRVRNGRNHDAMTLELKWENIDRTEGGVIFDFLEARGGDEAFYYDPPFIATGKKWTCGNYKRVFNEPNTMMVSGTFKECFDA